MLHNKINVMTITVDHLECHQIIRLDSMQQVSSIEPQQKDIDPKKCGEHDRTESICPSPPLNYAFFETGSSRLGTSYAWSCLGDFLLIILDYLIFVAKMFARIKNKVS